MSNGRKLSLALTIIAALALAFAVGCRGFFVKPTLSSITINPSSPSVQVGQTTTLQAFGVDSTGQGSNLTSGVSWSTSDPNTATVTGNGSAVLKGIALGTVTITASAQSVTNTATATVFITVSNMSILPQSQSVKGLSGTTSVPYVVWANGQTVDISSGATVNAFLNGTQVTSITCDYDPNGSAGPGQYCSGDGTEQAGVQYTLIATYPGTSITATAFITFNP